MSLTSVDHTASSSSNVRLVAVDEHHQPRYLVRAAKLNHALLVVAAKNGIEAGDMPALRGMCVEAVRNAEQHGR